MKPTLRSLLLTLFLYAGHSASAQQIKSTSYTINQPSTHSARYDSTLYSAADDSCRAVYRYMQLRQLRQNNTSIIVSPTGAKSYYLKSGLYSEEN